MAGITENGFEKKSFNDILNEMIDEAKNIFGDDIDLRDETFLRQWLVTMAIKEAERWDILEDIYNNFSVSTATNTSLDYAVKFQGLSRKSATKAIVDVLFTGDEHTIINSGFVVQTSSGIKFQTLSSGTIDGGGGNITLQCEALDVGSDGNVLAGTITEVESPLIGLSSVINNDDADGGLALESDESLRLRFIKSLAKGGGSTSNAIRATILSLENVEDVLMFENDTDEIVNGLEAHSFSPYVLGGEDLDIQTAIFEVKSMGIRSVGTYEHTFETDSGSHFTVGFERPQDVNIWLNITLETNNDYPIDGENLVKQATIWDNLQFC